MFDILNYIYYTIAINLELIAIVSIYLVIVVLAVVIYIPYRVRDKKIGTGYYASPSLMFYRGVKSLVFAMILGLFVFGFYCYREYDKVNSYIMVMKDFEVLYFENKSECSKYWKVRYFVKKDKSVRDVACLPYKQIGR